MTREFFLAQMRRLVGLRFVPASFDTHWEGLRDVPIDILEAAVTRAQKTRVEFPTPFELRQDADIVAYQRPSVPEPARPPAHARSRVEEVRNPFGGPPVTIAVVEDWSYRCERCSDTGWEVCWCGRSKRQPWVESRNCGTAKCRTMGEGYCHEWTQACLCRDSNQVLQARREKQATYAATTPTRGRV